MKKHNPSLRSILLCKTLFLLTLFTACKNEQPPVKLDSKGETKITKGETEDATNIIKSNPADFVPNPELETEISEKEKAPSYKVIMEEKSSPQSIQITNGVATLRLKGSLQPDTDLPEETAFVLRVYSNKKEDYSIERSILNIPINLRAIKGDAFPFRLKANLRVSPGLYYYVIAEKGKEKALHVGRFEVQTQ